MSRFIKTLIALIAAAGLWALIYFYEYGGEAERLEAQDAESRLFSFDEESIAGLEIAASGNGLALRRDGTGWAIVEPVATRADAAKVGSILSAATRLRVEERLEEVTESELESFGLREPSARVTLSPADQEPLEVDLGEEVPVTGGYYAMKTGDPAVLVVTGGVDSLTTASLESLRDKTIVGIDLWELQGFALSGEGTTVRLARDDDVWRIEEPVSFPADQAKLRELWTGLAWLEAQRVAVEKPEPVDLADRGLDSPALRLDVLSEEEDFSVDFGGADETGAVFVKRSDLDAVMTVPRDVFDRLDAARTAVDGLRDPRLAPVDRFRLERLEIAGDSTQIVLTRNDGGEWRRDGSENPVPPERIDPLLDALEDLRADGFAEKVSEEPSEIVLTLQEGEGGDGEEARIITISLLADRGGEDRTRRMSSTISPSTVYSVPDMAVQTLIDRIAAMDDPIDDTDPGETE